MFRRKDEPDPSEQVTRLRQEVRRSRDLLARRFAAVGEERRPPSGEDGRTSGVLYRVFQALGGAGEI